MTPEQRLANAERFYIFLCDLIMELNEEIATLRVQRLMVHSSTADRNDRMRAH